MMEGEKQKQKHRASYVPHDVVESSILSRLPVKSLLRFKSVCKQWSATISDPKFSETHLQLSNTCSDLISREFLGPFRRISLENDEFRQLSTVEYPPPIVVSRNSLMLCCSCDGLLLFCCRTSRDYNTLFLWNPSSRTYRYLQRCPYVLHPKIGLISGICYDPLRKDYKVVVCVNKHYAVHYCKTNSWSESMKMNIDVKCPVGVHFKGSIYWFSSSSSSKGDGVYRFEIVCFDGRDEKWKKTKNSHILDWTCNDATLTSSRDSLYFIPEGHRMNEIVIMKKVGHEHDDPWIELKVKLHPFSCDTVLPLCSTLDNKIIFFTNDKGDNDQYLLYDDNAKSGACTKISILQGRQQGEGRLVSPWFLSPYLENMFLL